MKDVIIIDYGMGNLGSVQNMFKKIGVVARISSSKKEIISAKAVILPGVGKFDEAIRNLRSLDLIDTIKGVADNNVPILGICLGMQLLADSSEEGFLPGLGLIPGKVKKFHKQEGLKIPHMGWNRAVVANYDSLFFGEENWRFYFVHSYWYDCNDSYVLSKTKHGLEFTSSVVNNNIFGVQFHPEKSHQYGMNLLKNFINLVCAGV